MRFLRSHPVISMFALFLASGVFVNAILPTEKQWTHVMWTATTTGDHVYNIATGSQEGELVFIGIAGRRIDAFDNQGVESIVTGGGTVGENWHWLLRPDGTKTELPAARQIFESIDGRWRESGRRVTLEQWKDFLNGNPDEITIDALFSWVDQNWSK